MRWCPLGKFNCDFSIVSAVRGQYITANESCQFYYQWSKARQIKTKLHTTPSHLHKIAPLDQFVTRRPLHQLSDPSFSLPLTLFCLSSSVFCVTTLLLEKPASSLHLPRACGPRRVYWRPNKESQKAEIATGKPWGPPPPHGSQLLQLQDQCCTLPASHGSVCLPVVSISSVGFLS